MAPALALAPAAPGPGPAPAPPPGAERCVRPDRGDDERRSERPSLHPVRLLHSTALGLLCTALHCSTRRPAPCAAAALLLALAPPPPQGPRHTLLASPVSRPSREWPRPTPDGAACHGMAWPNPRDSCTLPQHRTHHHGCPRCSSCIVSSPSCRALALDLPCPAAAPLIEKPRIFSDCQYPHPLIARSTLLPSLPRRTSMPATVILY